MAASNPLSPCPTLPVFVFSLGSGNSIFRSSLCQSEYFRDHGEVFGNEFHLDWEFRTLPKCENRFSLIGINYESIGQMFVEAGEGGSPPELITWLNAKQYPVVHLVRQNPLDCLVDQIVSDPLRFVDDATSDLNVTAVVARVSEMQRLVNRFRRWLTPANQVELQYEALLDGNGQISRLAVHQFCGLLGLDSCRVKTRRVAPSTVGVNQTQASRLKRQLRPAFIRVGYEHLFPLPKAA